jgi:hypothetical protein
MLLKTVGCGRGFVNVSKDGLIGADGHLQVFGLTSGTVINRFRLPITASSKRKSPVAPLATDEWSSTFSSSGVSSEDDNELAAGGTTSENSTKTMTSSAKTLLTTPVISKYCLSPRVLPNCLRRVSDGSEMYGEDRSATIVTSELLAVSVALISGS